MLRWALPGALLAGEFLSLSVLVDLPTSGPAIAVVDTIRLIVPVVLGAAVGGWLLARRGILHLLREAASSLPPWRPWPALVLHLLAFAATAALASLLMGEDAPPVAPGALLSWLVLVALSVVLAVGSAAPLGWTRRLVVAHWKLPVLSVAVGLVAWAAAAMLESTWGTLSRVTLRGVAWLLRRVTTDVVVDASQRVVGAGGFDVEIAPICSGISGVGLVLVFQAVWMFVSRSSLRLPAALILLPLGALAALLANVVRIAGLILLGASGRESLAMGGFHSKFGWVLFVPIALGSVALAERVPWLRQTNARGIETEVPPAAAAYVAPLVAALMTSLVTGLWSDGPFDAWYSGRIAVALATLWLVRGSLPSPSLSRAFVPVALAVAVAALWIGFGGGPGGGALAEAVAGLDPARRWGWIAARVAGSCLVIPIVEEVAFRGFLLPALVSPDFERVPPRAWSWGAVLVSSVAFGAIHGNWLLGTLAGCAFAAARAWRGRLSDAIFAHALSNAFVAAAVGLGGRWDLWA